MADISVLIDVIGTEDMVKATKTADRMRKEYSRLDREFNKGNISAQQYAKGIQQVDLKVDQLISGHKVSKVAINAHTQAVKGNTGALATNAMATQKATKSTKQFASIGLQQVGYQVSDFAVQVQGGTNALVAFGQQGSQLAGLLFLIPGFWGAVAGAVASIAIPVFTALGNVFLSIEENATKAAEVLQEDFNEAIDAVERSFKNATQTVSQFQDAIENINVSNLQKQFKALGQQTGDTFGAGFAENFFNFVTTNTPLFLDFYTQGFQTWGEISGKNTGEAFAQAFGQSTVNGVFNQGTLEAISKYIENLNVEALDQTLLALEANLQNANAEGRAFFENLVKVRDQVEEIRWATELVGEGNLEAAQNAIDLADEIGRARVEALEMSGYDLASPIADAVIQASRLAEQLGISVQRAIQIQDMGVLAAQGEQMKGGLGGPTGQFKVFEGAEDPLGKRGTIVNSDMFKSPSKSGRSGGRGKDPVEELRKAQEAVDQLRASYDKAYATELKVAEAKEKVNKLIELNPELTNKANQVLQDYIASLEDADTTMADFANDSAKKLADAFVSIVDGSKSASDAFRDMARSIIEQAFRMAGINPIINSIFGGVSGFTKLPSFFANGAAFSNGKVTAFADGGVVNQPTMFPMANGAGLMGEAGPEAIMPLKRGKNGKLGVQVEGGSQQPVVINQSFNFSANGDESVKRIIAQEAPKIANLTQKQILDQRRRGGVMKSTFG